MNFWQVRKKQKNNLLEQSSESQNSQEKEQIEKQN